MHNSKDHSKNLLRIPHFRILGVISIATLVNWAALTLVVLKLDPYESAKLALTLFFITSFLTLSGTFTIILFLLKKWRSEDNIYLKHLIISLRQGILLSACTNICLGLLMLGLLRIWNGLIIVTVMTLLEFYFSGKDELR
jgi:hypothetical protein